MRRLTIAMICICLLMAMFGCHRTEDRQVLPATQYATITFVINPDLYAFAAPDPIQAVVGEPVTLPLPENGVPMDECDRLCWFSDEALSTPYDETRPVLGDMTLYLYEVGRTYRITYQGFEGYTLHGEMVDSYQYLGERKTLPTLDLEGYYEGLYCVELDMHYIKVPTAEGRDLTFTMPKRIEHEIHYASGIAGVPMSEVDNSGNPTVYSTVGGSFTLQPAHYEGKTFKCWVVRLTSTRGNTFVVDGEEVTLEENTVLDTLTYDMIVWGLFVLEAKWQ